MRIRRQNGQPPGPRGRWLSGNLEAYEADRLGFLLDTRDRFGGVVRFDGRSTIIHDPDLALEVLGEKTGAFAIRQDVMQRRVEDSSLESWRDARRALAPGMRPQAAERMPAIVTAVTQEVLGGGSLSRDTAVDAMPLLESITSRSIARFCFGDDVGDIPQEVGHLLDLLSKLIGNPFALPSAIRTPTRRAIGEQFALVERLVDERLSRREAAPGAYGDYAASVVSVGSAHPRERLCRALVGALLAAHRVPAAAIGWTLWLTAGSDELWRSLQVEATAPSTAFHKDSAFPTATAAIYEALRLYPPSWLLSRTTTRPVEVGGYELGAGHQVLVSPYVLHRDPIHFPDADAFRPDRWTESSFSQRVRPRAYIPYGVGTRACPGANVGHHMLMAAVLTVVGAGVRVDGSSVVTPDPRTMLVPRGLRLVSAGSNVGQVLAGARAS